MSGTARVVIAPDSFKGSLGAREAARAIGDGWLSVRPHDHVELRPQADGGEGTIDAVEANIAGAERHRVDGITGPAGQTVVGEWLELPDGTGVTEIAQMSGLPLMGELDPLGATSRGLGEVMAVMLDAGVSRILVGLGGSASTDGGLPVLDAIEDRRPPERGVLLLADVTAPLLGPAGAAAVFAPQKGASASQVSLLEERLRGVAQLLRTDPFEPGVGAAGGVGYALRSWGGTLTKGSSYIATLTGVTAAIEGADVVLTGEGRYDGQSLGGKVVGNILGLAREAGVRCGIIAGTADEVPECWITTLRGFAGSTEAAIARPAEWLFMAGRQAATHLLSTSHLQH